MDYKQRQDLDRYITGNYGEDQFKGEDAFWPDISAHQEYWEMHNNPHVYEYDPTDDGPEVVIVARIKAAFPITWNPFVNDAAAGLTRGLMDRLRTTLAAIEIEENLGKRGL